MFRNTLTANDKYPFREWENLLSAIQMEFSLKLKSFSDFFVQFLDSKSNYKHFGKKDDRHSFFITAFTGCERLD